MLMFILILIPLVSTAANTTAAAAATTKTLKTNTDNAATSTIANANIATNTTTVFTPGMKSIHGGISCSWPGGQEKRTILKKNLLFEERPATMTGPLPSRR